MSKKNPKSKSRKTSTPKVVQKEEPQVEHHIISIGPSKMTRFERARIIGARALQLSLGAPPFIPLTSGVRDQIELAIAELQSGALPISIRRSLPDGRYQDIPLDWLL